MHHWRIVENVLHTMLEKKPVLFHTAAAVRSAEGVPSELQSPAYWELYCFTDCWET